MEIQLKNVERLATSYDVTRAIAKVLHGRSFANAQSHKQSRPLNFSIALSPDTVPNSIRNGGSGTLIIPFLPHAQKFLRFLETRRVRVKVRGKPIHFHPSNKAPRRRTIDTLAKVCLLCYGPVACLILLSS